MESKEFYIYELNEFAKSFGLTLSIDGEVGFGRPCVGLLKGSSYVYYNPYKYLSNGEIEILE
jgi:hypothetical protein